VLRQLPSCPIHASHFGSHPNFFHQLHRGQMRNRGGASSTPARAIYGVRDPQSMLAIALTRVAASEPTGGTKYPGSPPPAFLP